jgi:hypothetical protein
MKYIRYEDDKGVTVINLLNVDLISICSDDLEIIRIKFKNDLYALDFKNKDNAEYHLDEMLEFMATDKESVLEVYNG